MGLFDLFRGKHKKKIETKYSSFSIDIEKDIKIPASYRTLNEQVNYVKDNCEAIMEYNRQIEEAKTEYQAVTSYLTDMQKIDLIPLEQRGRLNEAANNIINLTKEREKYQKQGSSFLPDRQYHIFEQYELQIPKELPRLKENEQLKLAIEQDMEHLENERMVLEEEQEEIIDKQSFLKGIAIAVSIVIVFLFFLFVILSSKNGADYIIPFCLTVLMGISAAFYIVMEARKNEVGINLVQLKQRRLITLVNKVKIKSVNNLNYLEYTYNKYMVQSFEQFKTLWEEYKRLKEEARRYQNNTDNLEFYNKELIHELKKFGISDSDIWIFQASAILDNKEMVEVRHRLNVRRQKLRERIDINIRQQEEALSEIKKIRSNDPECINETDQILRNYKIEIEE
jgi:hypothetical protein